MGALALKITLIIIAALLAQVIVFLIVMRVKRNSVKDEDE
jgi:hypothetical protein